MKHLLKKELTLSASPLAYLFIAFGLMFLIPGYPILCGAFFVTLGLFQSFQAAREANDTLFSALLPVAKRDVVKARFLFCCCIEGCALLVMAAAAALRMTWLQNAAVYRENPLMNANLFALGAALLIFGCFNRVFVAGFFKTAYNFARPFVAHIALTFVIMALCETLHHLPGCGALNAFGFEQFGLQLALFALGLLTFAALTALGCRRACRSFETIDL